MTKKRTFRSFSSSHHHKADPIGFLQAFSQYVPALLYSRRHPQSTNYPYLRHLTSACNRHISSYNPHNHLTFPPHHQNFHTFHKLDIFIKEIFITIHHLLKIRINCPIFLFRTGFLFLLLISL